MVVEVRRLAFLPGYLVEAHPVGNSSWRRVQGNWVGEFGEIIS